jgi:hypothetical protein
LRHAGSVGTVSYADDPASQRLAAFFYADERREPIHVHAEKGEMECKYWLDREDFAIEEAFSHGMGPGSRREVREIIFRHFEQIEAEWDAFQRLRQP